MSIEEEIVRIDGRRLAVHVPGAGHLLVVPTWRRVLSHLAPQRPR